MPLRDDAVAAYAASQSGVQGQARAALAQALTPENVAGLSVADMQVNDSYTLFVFTDGDLNLAVKLPADATDWEVSLVTGSTAAWTEVGAVESLAELGKLAPKVAKATTTPPAPTYPAWQPQISVTAGLVYTYGGAKWKCLQSHTTQVGWEPPNVPALWVQV